MSEGKPSVCPTCGSGNPSIKLCATPHDGDLLSLSPCRECMHDWHSSPVPAATTTPVQVTRIEEIAEDLAAAIYEVQQGTDEMAIKTLLIDFAKEIQRAAIEPTGF